MRRTRPRRPPTPGLPTHPPLRSQTVNRETGQKEALSYRCADIDRWAAESLCKDGWRGVLRLALPGCTALEPLAAPRILPASACRSLTVRPSACLPPANPRLLGCCRVVPQLMGVSKAVLENVIFVHQVSKEGALGL